MLRVVWWLFVGLSSIGRVLRKIWLMFQSQELAVGFGNLGLSITISLLVRLSAPRQGRVQLDEKYTVPEPIVDTLVFVGAFTCVSILWQTAMIVGDFVAYL
ncbi:hypothetical protein EV361DRAFT_943113 [Lentinula raphanica]|nr:hypothetical protein EV361DRAFT_943113 [Lentinula raphanica]